MYYSDGLLHITWMDKPLAFVLKYPGYCTVALALTTLLIWGIIHARISRHRHLKGIMAATIKKIDKATADERLVRFNGEPGVTEGLGNDEMLELFQYLIDSGEVYSMTDGTQYHVQAWSDEGYLTGFDASRMQS